MSDQTDDSEKTEDPTQKRLREAHDKGDVPKSQEMSTWFALAGTAILIALLAPGMSESLAKQLKWYIEHAHELPVDGFALRAMWRDTGQSLALIVGLPLLVLVVMATAGNLVQHKLLFTAETVKPKLSKISPLSGFKRLFSKDSLINFAKGMLKIVLVGVMMVAILWPHRDRADTIIFADTLIVLETARELVLQLLAAILAFMTVVAIADFMYQKQKWFNKQKMSLREVKEEYKQTEGDPLIKGKIRQLRMERSRKRMMAAVPEATVVVTNPTHYSVALKYEEGMGAPLCLAKGVDTTALKIREVAKEHNIPIVENPPLARALYANVDIEQEVPEEHYKAVAEVIGFVFRMRRKSSWRAN